MNQTALLEFGLNQLRDVVSDLDASDLDTLTNCEPWTVHRLASHALNNQLRWGGLVAGQVLVTDEATMGAVPHEGDLAVFADDVAHRASAMWRQPGVLAATHATPFGELPGSAIIMFPTIDALAHAWDLSVSVGRPIEFAPEAMPDITSLVDATCTDAVRDLGLIEAATHPPADATATERLMAISGRTVSR